MIHLPGHRLLHLPEKTNAVTGPATHHTICMILSSAFILPLVGCIQSENRLKVLKSSSRNIRKGRFIVAVNMEKCTVKEIIMYPIKSCKGISLNSAHLSETGESSTYGSPTLLSLPSLLFHRVKVETPFERTPTPMRSSADTTL